MESLEQIQYQAALSITGLNKIYEVEVKCRTSKYMNSFFPNGVKGWNNIDENIRNCDTLSKYKRKIFLLYVLANDPFSGFMILVELNTFSNLGWV